MSTQKLTRNPGWSRLFRVFSGIWYAVIVSVFVWGFVQQEQAMNMEFAPKPKSTVQIPEGFVIVEEADLDEADRKRIAEIDAEIALIEAEQARRQIEKRFNKRKSLSLLFLPFVFAPWVLLFSLRLFRYVIEGFTSENE